MKRIFLVAPFLSCGLLWAQFTIKIASDADFTPKEAYIYTESGSKDILLAKVQKQGLVWTAKSDKPYTGMMKAYFPETNSTLNFISENKDVNINFSSAQGKIKEVVYHDQPNMLMDEVQQLQRQKDAILPALYEMKSFYKSSSEFSKAMDIEIARLNKDISIDASKNPFVEFYLRNYAKYLGKSAGNSMPTQNDVITLFSTSDEKLETSSLIQPILVNFIQNSGNKPEADIDRLLDAVKVESPRGQMILSELIEIFDAYGTTDLKAKYLNLASNLKCTISDRLASTIASNKNTEVGAAFPDYKFSSPTNTTAKSIHAVNADRKLIILWSSTCSHCEQELPQIIPVYSQMQSKKIAVIGLSVDADRQSYENKVKNFPWINDAELRGWRSSYADTYNVHATPTYFILDSKNKIIAKPDHIGDALKFLGLK